MLQIFFSVNKTEGTMIQTLFRLFDKKFLCNEFNFSNRVVLFIIVARALTPHEWPMQSSGSLGEPFNPFKS